MVSVCRAGSGQEKVEHQPWCLYQCWLEEAGRCQEAACFKGGESHGASTGTFPGRFADRLRDPRLVLVYDGIEPATQNILQNKTKKNEERRDGSPIVIQYPRTISNNAITHQLRICARRAT